MIAEIIKLCNILPFYGGGKNVEIAKGKYAMVRKWSKLKEQVKRETKK